MSPDQAKFLLDCWAPGLADEAKTTRKVLAAIPEANLDYRPDPKSRTAMELAWHIAVSEHWFYAGIAGGQFATEVEPPMPENVKAPADIVAWYETNVPPARERLQAVSPEALAAEMGFFGVMKAPAVTYLMFLLLHSAHHRGQLSTYLRAMGGKVPDIYGGSADEPWSG